MASALTGDDLARSVSRSMSYNRSMSRRNMSLASGSRRGWASASIREAWNNQTDVFQRSGREEDEEELKWAAIERLPTYDRIRQAMLKHVMEEGKIGYEQVDITNLDMNDKKNLMESILRVVEEDNERFLRRLRERTDRVGIDVPKIEVRFQHLSIDGDAYLGTRALPTLLNSTLNTIEGVLGLIKLFPSKKRVVNILRDVSGIVKPSRMTLLLGPPGSGKTTLLQALAGKTDTDLRISGKITYCGHEFEEFIPQRTSAYISQHDLHHGEMTVRETLDFSGRCLGVGTRYELLAELSRREKQAGIKPDPEIDAFMKATAMAGQNTSLVTDYVLKVLDMHYIRLHRIVALGDSKAVTPEEEDESKNQPSSHAQPNLKSIEMRSPSTNMAVKNNLDNSVPSAANQAPSKRGMVLPFQPLSLAFNHVNYYVDMPAEIPIWWRWYYWASPVAWTINGLVTSQVGDKDEPVVITGELNTTVKAYLETHLGFNYDFLPAIIAAHIGWVLLFLFVFAYGIKFLNFQRR
ncbi:hypothetical protein V6N13_012608 [Hibiscus sabdariffa]